MKNYSVFLCLCFSVIVMAQKSKDLSISEFTTSLEQKLVTSLKEKNVPGMAVAIIDDGDVIYKNGLGYSDVANQVKVDSKTGFNIGSISKMFTAWGVMKLVEKGKIKLDTPVENYLTRWKIPESAYDKSKVTIRSLLGHTGGVSVHGYPGFHPDAALPTLEASLEGVNGPVRADEKVELIHEPQTKFKYSGGGYTILQLMIEEITGKSFAVYMTNEVFKPLGMKHTSFTIDKRILKSSAKPYDENGKEIYLERFTAQAAAGLHTTLEDLLHFVNASFEENKVLSAKTLNQMLIPTKLSKNNYGLGYTTIAMGPITIKGHTGSNTGWQSAFLMDFEKRSGFIALTNGSNGESVARKVLSIWRNWKVNQLTNKK
ncbi:serine hydrolase [Flavobacteriaceae bacterium R38]|nr:serine hydrolase [Flavobacteriaceae bacterium R38]